jgi:D-alanyl-lipoteichoic acid acyltransferase DltB (MBOAT superfamily)
MLFNSYSFIFAFLPVVFIGTFWLGRRDQRLATWWLALASLVFYSVWDARFVWLLLLSIAFNFGAGRWIGRYREAGATGQGKRALTVAIAANLALLAYFKYANFFLEVVHEWTGQAVPALDILLPLGISFFTFTQIAFLVDVHRGIAREHNFAQYLLFVTYFPHLIAGPVLHHKQMMPQFAEPANFRIDAGNVAVGLTVFVLGLAKKVLIADRLAEYATPVFMAAEAGQVLMPAEAWTGALAYSLQLYFDFSGYSDMAIGLSLMFNIRLPMNFDSPYKSTSIVDFWRRWHMTLSAFLRDYLYIPLGGNRRGALSRYTNLMVTMVLGGLWHGAGWTFLVWGALHGFYLLVNHAWRGLKARWGWGDGGLAAHLAGGALTFLAVVVAWVFFRADSMGSAWSMLSSMAGLGEEGGGSGALVSKGAVRAIVVGLCLVWLFPNVRQMVQAFKPTWEDMAGVRTPAKSSEGRLARWLTWTPSRVHAVAMALLLIWCLDSFSKVSEFLYFRF